MNPSPSQKWDSAPSLLHVPDSYLIWIVLLDTSRPVSIHLLRADISSTTVWCDRDCRQDDKTATQTTPSANMKIKTPSTFREIMPSLLAGDYIAAEACR